MTELIAFRAFQGIGGSLWLPGSLAIISATFHGRERGAAIGIWSAMSGVAVAVGPLVGGYLVQNVNWQSVFYGQCVDRHGNCGVLRPVRYDVFHFAVPAERGWL